ncbi:MAG: VWA domain-containing protein [Ignavibacteria bacterium]|nr:VWA domain-containing protein [Ignavibacteria bacterium]
MIRSFFVCFVVLLTTGPLFGQSLDLHVRKATLDARDVLTLDLVQYAAGSDGRVALEPSMLTLTIDGKIVPITSIVCPEPPSPVELSSVLTIDISGSMVRGGPNITLARSAAYAWIRALSAGSDCAITAFDHKASLVSDFTSDTAALMKAIAALTPRGGTDYDAGLLTEEIGGLSMAATGRGKRVLIFLTDGIGTANTSYMIEQARLNGITVYCVSLGMSMPESLRTLSEESGGLWFENVTTVEQAEMAYRRIHADATSPLSCSAKAELPPSCSKERVLVLSSSKESIRRIIATPDSSVTQASIKPLSLRFEKGAPQQRISIRAGSMPLTLTGVKVTSLSPVRVMRGEVEIVFPIVIDALDSAMFTVVSEHRDSIYAVGRIQFSATPCPLPTVYTSSGKPVGRPLNRTIHVVYPNGGERIPAHAKQELRYDGVPADLPVRVEVSYDLGNTWTLISERATGHDIPWNAPSISSDSCLLRVSQVVPDEIRMQPVSVIRGVRIEQCTFIGDGTRLASAALVQKDARSAVDSLVRITDANTGDVIHTFPGVRYAVVRNGTSILTWGLTGVLASYDLNTGKQQWTAEIAPSTQLITCSPNADGTIALVLGGWDDRPRVIDCVTGLTIARLPKNTRDIESGIISPDGSMVALCSRDSSISIYDARSGTLRQRLTGSTPTQFIKAAFSPSSTQIVATAANGTAVVWNVAEGLVQRVIAKRQYVNDNSYVTFLPDGSRVVLETGKDQTSIVDIASGENIVTMQRTLGVGGVMTAVSSRDGSRVALSSLGRVTVHETATGVMIYEMRQVDYNPSFSADGSRLALRTSESEAGVYEISPAILQADSSDASWAIFLTKAKLRNVRFSQLPVGESIDSVIRGGLVNGTLDTIRLDRLRIEGSEVRHFGLRTLPGAVIPPGDSIDIEYSFTPNLAGERAALIVAEVTGGVLRARISGPARGNILSAEAEFLNCGVLDVGESRDVVADGLIYNSGKTPVRIRSIKNVGPDASSFELLSESSFVVEPGEKRELLIRFSALREGRVTTRLAFDIEGYPETLYATVYGRGAIDTFRVALSDPTTFRGILLPTAVIPPKGTFTSGVYDVLGLTGGYSITDNVMATIGGVLPLPNRWFGASGYDASWSAAWSLGAKAGFVISPDIVVGGGYQLGQSYYDQDVSEKLESKITFNALWATAGWGNDDSRLNTYLGYAFKYHTTGYEGSYNADATIFGVGYDRRLGYHWKICGEVFFMRTMTFVPITVTARYFDAVQAFEFGLTVTGIAASGAEASSWPVIPMVSWVRRW